MSILIKGIEMPKRDEGLVLMIFKDGKVYSPGILTQGLVRMKNVEAISVPAPHGRLKDADALEQAWIWGSTDRTRNVECIELCDLKNAPTVIDAEE